MVICDHSELLQAIADLQLENKQLRKQDKHREKTWKKRVTEMQRKNADLLEAVEDMDYTKKLRAKITELEASCDALHNYISDKNIPELEATIERVKALRPETVDVGFGLTFVIPLERLEVALEDK